MSPGTAAVIGQLRRVAVGCMGWASAIRGQLPHLQKDVQSCGETRTGSQASSMRRTAAGTATSLCKGIWPGSSCREFKELSGFADNRQDAPQVPEMLLPPGGPLQG